MHVLIRIELVEGTIFNMDCTEEPMSALMITGCFVYSISDDNAHQVRTSEAKLIGNAINVPVAKQLYANKQFSLYSRTTLRFVFANVTTISNSIN